MIWGYCFAIVFPNIPIIFYPPCRSDKWCFQVTLVITINQNINNLPLYYLLNHHRVNWKFWIWYNTVLWYMYMIYYHNGWCMWNLGTIYSATILNINFNWVWSINLSLSSFTGGGFLEEILHQYLGPTRVLFSLAPTLAL